jgi:hypothetical protein
MSSLLQQNSVNLQEILNTVNALPEEENLGAELSTQSNLILEQDAKIAELAQILAGKAGGGSEQPTLINFTLVYGHKDSPETINLQSDDKLNWGQWLFSSYNPFNYIIGNTASFGIRIYSNNI